MTLPTDLQHLLTERGFVIHRGMLGPEEVETLRTEADRLALTTGKTCVRNVLSLSEVFRRLALDPRIADVLRPGLAPVRSILFDKTADANWPVAWHQDLSIAVAKAVEIPCYESWSTKEGVAHVQPPLSVLGAMVTARIHLDDTPEANGALRVIPGSHRCGRLSREAINQLVQTGGEFVCECRPGDLLVMSPLLLHASRRAKNPSRRRIIHYEFGSEDALDPSLEWYETTEPGGRR